jgi:hypothetical protein
MITTFKEQRVVETCFEDLMDNIELHHGYYSQTLPFRELKVFGLKPTPAVEQVLMDFGFAPKEQTITAFLVERIPGNPKLETRN